MALVRLMDDKSVTREQRVAAFEQLKAMGPAARPATAALCKLLSRRDSSPVSYTALGRDVAGVLGSIGPDAAKSAIATVRSELEAAPPAGIARIYWNDVVGSLGPAAHPALAEALADKCDALAEIAARHLTHNLDKDPRDPNTTAALKIAAPKLPAAWQRATSATFLIDNKALSEPSESQRRERWIADLEMIANATGPKAQQALIAAAEAASKQKRADPAAATAAVKEYMRLVAQLDQPNPPPSRGWVAAERKVMELGSAAVPALSDAFLRDPSLRPRILSLLSSIIGKVPRAMIVNTAAIQHRILRGEPPPALPLDQRNRAAMAKMAPELGKLADTISPDGQNQPAASAIALLQAIAPDVPSAADALVQRLDRMPSIFAPGIADALARCDKSVQKKVEAAGANGNAAAKDVARLVRLRTMPAKEAAAEILATVPIDQRSNFVNRVLWGAGPEALPFVIELLVDPRSGADNTIKFWAQFAPAALVSALDRPEPRIRAGVLAAMPREAITPDVAKKAAGMIGEEGVDEAARNVLTMAGSIAFPAIVEQTHSEKPDVRAAAARALSIYVFDTIYEKYTPETRAKAGEAAVALLDDADAKVRAAALSVAARFPQVLRPALANRLKDATVAQREQLAIALLDGGNAQSGFEGFAGFDSLRAEVKKPAVQGGGFEWNPNRTPNQMPGLVVASLAIDPDPAVARSAEDVLIRADFMQLDRQAAASAASRAPTTQQAAAIAAVTTAPTAEARIAALHGMTEDRLLPAAIDAMRAAMDDKEPSVRSTAVSKIESITSYPAVAASLTLAKTIDLADADPSAPVRQWAIQTLDNLQRERLYPLRLRIRFWARSDDQNDRVLAAKLLRLFAAPRAQSPTPDAPADPNVDMLLKLIEDTAAPVCHAAVMSLARYIRFDDPQSPAAKAVVKLLDAPDKLDPDAKTALLGVVPELAAAGWNLDEHADAGVRAAALLGIEQPPTSPPVQERRVAIDVASAALTSPSQRVRRMAAHTLVFADPTDPNRLSAGAAALIVASNDQRDPIAIDALDKLVDAFCGHQVGPGETVWKQYPGFGEVGRTPSKYEVQMRRMIERTFKGTTADRVVAINDIGATGDPQTLAARWDAYIRLLDDPDPQVRAAAFAVARTLTAAAVAKYNAQAAPGAAAAARTPPVTVPPKRPPAGSGIK